MGAHQQYAHQTNRRRPKKRGVLQPCSYPGREDKKRNFETCQIDAKVHTRWLNKTSCIVDLFDFFNSSSNSPTFPRYSDSISNPDNPRGLDCQCPANLSKYFCFGPHETETKYAFRNFALKFQNATQLQPRGGKHNGRQRYSLF